MPPRAKKAVAAAALPPSAIAAQPLTVPETFKLGKAPWNVSKISNEDLLSTTAEGMLKMKYNVGKDGHDSGAQIFCNPLALLPVEEVTLAYDVFFSDDWDFVICGKLPGIGFGVAQGDHASGGEWDKGGKAGSFRIMWQDGTPDHALIKGYLYLAIPGGPGKAYDPQGPHFKEVGNDDDRTGYSVYYKKKPCFKVKKGEWNSVSFTVRMNTVGKTDGYLRMQINDTVREIDDIVWRTDDRTKIQDVYWVSIFGGEGKKFAPHNPDAYSMYRNIRVGVADGSAAAAPKPAKKPNKAVTVAAPPPQSAGPSFLSWVPSDIPTVAEPLLDLPTKTPRGLVMQFGVWKGGNLRKLARRFPDRIAYGFDTFETIKASDIDVPPTGRLVKGPFAESIPAFQRRMNNAKVAYVHFDSRINENAKDIFAALDIQDGTVVVFDEALEYPGWERHECRALFDFAQAPGCPWTVTWLARNDKAVMCTLVAK